VAAPGRTRPGASTRYPARTSPVLSAATASALRKSARMRSMQDVSELIPDDGARDAPARCGQRERGLTFCDGRACDALLPAPGRLSAAGGEAPVLGHTAAPSRRRGARD
jgi:hypothetical protein